MLDPAVERFAQRAALSGLLFGVLASLLVGFTVASSLTLSAVWWIGAWALHGVRRDLLTQDGPDRGGSSS